MRHFTLLCFICCLHTLPAQSLERTVVGAAGTVLRGPQGSLSFTVGESAVATTTENDLTLGRGFQQLVPPKRSTSATDLSTVDLELTVHPNPTNGPVELNGRWERGDRLTLTNILGRRLVDLPVRSGPNALDLTAYPSGTYLLTVHRDGRPIRTLRLVRN